MKKATLLLLAVISWHIPVLAQQKADSAISLIIKQEKEKGWLHVASSRESLFLIKASTVKRRSSELLVVWVKERSNLLSDSTYRLIQDEFNCSRNTYRIRWEGAYDEKGKVIALNEGISEWAPIIPDSIVEAIFAEACQ